MERYFRQGDELLASARRVREAGLGIVAFQGGDVPRTTRTIGEIIPDVKREFSGEVEVLLCLGDKSQGEYAYLSSRVQTATFSSRRHRTLSLHQAMRGSAARRSAWRPPAIWLGWGSALAWAPLSASPGRAWNLLADDILLAPGSGPSMTSASPFVPAPDTPLADAKPGDIDTTLNILAVMRLVNPLAFIPTVSA